MKPVGCLLLALLVLTGCRAAHNVAVTSFRVLDAPANFVRRQIDRSTESTTTTTTTTAASDTVTTPGRTVTPSSIETQRRSTTTQTRSRPNVRPSATPRSSPTTVTERSKPSATPSRTTSTQAQFPTAKPVPGKPGYVFSPFDPSGGYVDVNGYTPGQKVKDPYSGKIFLVP
ncbi:MAG TPA: hypothetical protein VM940_10800 [Chthoniobacterales bacterium]|nr:hypothetical protein [Chthoniobacterales bacterium]